MLYQFHSRDLNKGRTVPSFATPAASCPLAGLPRIAGLQPSKLAPASSVRYYTAGGSRLYRPTRPARRHPSSRPLRPRGHFRRVVPLGCYCDGDGYDEVRSSLVERRELLLPGRRLCPVRGQSGRTLVVVGGKVCFFVCALHHANNSARYRAYIGFAVDDRT